MSRPQPTAPATWFGDPSPTGFSVQMAAWQGTRDPVERARLAVPIARGALAQDGQPAAIQLLEDAALELGDAEVGLALDLEAELGLLALLDASTAALRWRRLDPFGHLPGDTPAERRVLAAVAVRCRFEGAWPAAFVQNVADRAFGDGRLVADAGHDPLHWTAVCSAYVAAEAFDEADRVVNAGRAYAEQDGWDYGLAVAEGLACGILRGRAAGAEARGRLIDLLARLGDEPVATGVAVAAALDLADVLIELGRPDEAQTVLAAQGLADGSSGDVRALRLLSTRGALAVARGDHGGGVETGRLRRSLEVETGMVEPETPWRSWAVQAEISSGDAAAAAALAAEQVEIAARWGTPRLIELAEELRARVAAP